MKALADLGHEVYAVCPRGEYFCRFEEEGIHAVSYEIERGSINPLKELQALKNILEALRPLNLDVLHTFTAKPNIYGALAGKKLGIKAIVCSVTGLGSFYIQEGLKARCIRFLIESLYRIAFALAKKTVFQNSEDLELFIRKGILRREKTALIRGSGIDMETFSPNPNRIQNDKTVVLMIARAIWDKGVREYYEAARILKDKRVRFLYVGDVDKGNISSADEAFMRSGNVEFLGHRDDVKELLESCDIFVLPSYREGLPRTLLEASAMKKAIITTDTTGCREVVGDGVNGFLVPVRSSEPLAEKIAMLANDENLRVRFGEAAYAKCKNEFDVRIVVKKHLELYEALV